MSRTSLIRLIEKAHNDNAEANFNEHVLIMLEADENGIPVGNITKVKGTPFQVLGMVDMAIRKLEEVRESVLMKFEAVENASSLMNQLPEELRAKVKDFENRAREAASKGDIDSLEKLRNALKEELGMQDNDDDSDESGFNLNDFKNGF